MTKAILDKVKSWWSWWEPIDYIYKLISIGVIAMSGFITAYFSNVSTMQIIAIIGAFLALVVMAVSIVIEMRNRKKESKPKPAEEVKTIDQRPTEAPKPSILCKMERADLALYNDKAVFTAVIWGKNSAVNGLSNNDMTNIRIRCEDAFMDDLSGNMFNCSPSRKQNDDLQLDICANLTNDFVKRVPDNVQSIYVNLDQISLTTMPNAPVDKSLVRVSVTRQYTLPWSRGGAI